MFERWDEVELDLRVEATLALDGGGAPQPVLAAFRGPEPLGVAGLRPFAHDGLLTALVEIMALLLPLGADRVALALAGRPEPQAGGAVRIVLSDAELAVERGALALLAISVEARGPGPCRLRSRLHPLVREEGRWHWRPDDAADLDARSCEVTSALATLVDGRGTLADEDPAAGRLHHQLARCLLRGHRVALAPGVAARLEPDRSGGGPTD
jgi:hypothetical protein